MLLLCYHYDPATGTYGAAVLELVRLGGIATVLAIADFLFVSLRRERAAARPGAHGQSILTMFTNFPFFPQQASVQAGQVDAVFFFMVAVTGFFSVLIASLVVIFAVKYRRRSDDEVGAVIHGSLALELLWTVIPFGIAMVMFGVGRESLLRHLPAARRRDGDLRRRQTVDVEDPAHGRTARDQRAARPAWAGPSS